MNATENREVMISVLKDLIHINTDRMNEYKKGIEQTKDHTDLRVICEEASAGSDHIISELLQYLVATSTQHDNSKGAIFNGWIAIKRAVLSEENSTLLDLCEKAEEASLKAYDLALKSGIHPESEVHITITRHRTEIEQILHKLRKLNSRLDKINI